MDYKTMFSCVIQGLIGGAFIGFLLMVIGISAYKLTEIMCKIFKV